MSAYKPLWLYWKRWAEGKICFSFFVCLFSFVCLFVFCLLEMNSEEGVKEYMNGVHLLWPAIISDCSGVAGIQSSSIMANPCQESAEVTKGWNLGIPSGMLITVGVKNCHHFKKREELFKMA